jgi:MYXO-CTERM domain-containing protein
MLLMALTTLAFARQTEPVFSDMPGNDGVPIINGEDATVDDWPATGGMLLDAFVDLGNFGSGDIRVFLCSSTLIAPDVVLLAAHCLDDYALTYGLGTVEDKDVRWSRQADLSDFDGSQRSPSWPEDAIAAHDWVMHEDFDLVTMQTGIANNADIALLFLEEAVTDVEHAYMVTPEEADQVVEDVDVVVVGWGMQEATDNPLQSPPAGTYLYKQMGDSYVGASGDHEFQVGVIEGDVRKCHGDSGGPTYFEVQDTGEYTELWRVVGVTSHAYDRTDCDSTGGVDTRVSAFYDWIDKEMRDRCADGTRVWCEVEGIVPPPEPVSVEPDTGASASGSGDGPLAGCGCTSKPTDPSAGWWIGLLGLVGLRRRGVKVEEDR